MAVSRLRSYCGPAFLSYGFRPFFLLGSLYAALSILFWLPMYAGELDAHSAFVPVDWHIHEMLFGYLPAILTGFLLTAIPNWTGRLPVQGLSLLALVVLWLAGRVAVFFSADLGWQAAAVID
ncbi:MAG: short-chain dehydrogenase, partial [Mesorhizobium sp.]